jgi:hypothetical protein
VAIDGVVGSMQHEGAEQQHEVPRHRGVARDVGRGHHKWDHEVRGRRRDETAYLRGRGNHLR